MRRKFFLLIGTMFMAFPVLAREPQEILVRFAKEAALEFDNRQNTLEEREKCFLDYVGKEFARVSFTQDGSDTIIYENINDMTFWSFAFRMHNAYSQCGYAWHRESPLLVETGTILRRIADRKIKWPRNSTKLSEFFN